MNRSDEEGTRDESLVGYAAGLRYTTTVVDGEGVLILDVNDLHAWLRSTVVIDLSRMA